MSHFTVGVIHKPSQDIDEMLAPFYECLDTEFIDCTEEVEDAYRNSARIMWKTADGQMHETRDDMFKILISDDEYYNLPANIPRTTDFNAGKSLYYKYIPESFGAEKVEVPYSEIYPTIEEFAESYYGYGEYDGCFGYWVNPQAKWDWYEVGGRWNGMLKLKPGCEGVMGFDGVFGRREEYDDDMRCSEARIKDIDFSPDKDEYDAAIRFWELVIDHEPLKEGETMPFNMWKEEYYTSRYKDKEDYATRNSTFTTFAVLTSDGEWHEPGTMGWFGCNDSTAESQEDWDVNYHKFIENADPDDIFTVVDCHI